MLSIKQPQKAKNNICSIIFWIVKKQICKQRYRHLFPVDVTVIFVITDNENMCALDVSNNNIYVYRLWGKKKTEKEIENDNAKKKDIK